MFASRYSLDSTEENSFSRDSFSLHRNPNDVSSSSITRQDSASSIHTTSSNAHDSSTLKSSRSRNTFHNQDLYQRESKNLRGYGSASSRNKLAEVTINDLEKDESEENETLRSKLSASKAECTDLRRQIEQVKNQLEDSTAKKEGIDRFCKELEEQVKFLKESNSNLSLQISKTQESNIDLLSVLQEMEESIENQRMGGDRDVVEDEMESLKHKMESLESDCSELTDENLQLVFKLKEMENLRAWNGSSEKESELQEDLKRKDVLYEQLSRKHSDQETEVAALEQELERCHRETSVAADLDDGCKCNYSVDDDLEMTKATYFITQSGQHETVLKKLADMRNLVDSKDDDVKAAETNVMNDNILQSVDQELGNLYGLLESRMKDLQKEVSLEAERVKAASKEEIKVLRNAKTELERTMNSVNNEKQELKVKVSKLEADISSMELECNQSKLEGHLCEVEEENLRLSERICGLEAQLRYLTNEKETSRSALHNSESRCSKLDQHVRELEGDVQERKKKANEMQKLVLEGNEECGYLRVAHQMMQATAETLMEECISLQKSNLDLRTQRMELQEKCNLMEAELSESRRSFDNLSEEIQVVREKLGSLSEESSLKESAINAELDALILETTALSSNSHLLLLLQGFDIGEIPLLPEDINLKFNESEARLKDELAELRQNQELLMCDRDKLLDLVEDIKSKESRTKARMRNLEMNFKACEYNRNELMDDVTNLKVQLSRTQILERNLKEVTFENQRLEASLQVIRGVYESVQKERDLISEQMSRLESDVLMLEACRNSKEVLEERVLRLEGDLIAKEALYSEEAELKNELARVRRANNQLQRRLHEQEHRFLALQEEQQQQQPRKNSSSSSSSCIVKEPVE